VVGSSGSGKTTTAAAIAARLRVPHLELDAVHWLPGWEERDPDEFRRIVFDFAAQPRWVIDGNYMGRLGARIDHLVDTYVWLDLPRWRVMAAVLARTLRRGITGEELWGTGNREHLSSLFKREPTDNIVLWAWTQHDKNRNRYAASEQAGQHRWVRLRSRRAVERFLAAME
jgi:adenylate kinase family enzyme